MSEYAKTQGDALSQRIHREILDRDEHKQPQKSRAASKPAKTTPPKIERSRTNPDLRVSVEKLPVAASTDGHRSQDRERMEQIVEHLKAAEKEIEWLKENHKEAGGFEKLDKYFEAAELRLSADAASRIKAAKEHWKGRNEKLEKFDEKHEKLEERLKTAEAGMDDLRQELNDMHLRARRQRRGIGMDTHIAGDLKVGHVVFGGAFAGGFAAAGTALNAIAGKTLIAVAPAPLLGCAFVGLSLYEYFETGRTGR